MTDYGAGFILGEQMMLLSFKRESDEMPLINFRVDNIEEIMQELKEIGLVTDEIRDYEYGRFAHFTDPFGNDIELWEPNEKKYREMVRGEINRYLSGK